MAKRVRQNHARRTILAASALATATCLAGGAIAEEPPAQRQVVFEASERAELQVRQREGSGKRSWRTLCKGPCTTTVYRGELYRVDGKGVATSSEFKFDAGSDAVHLKAETSSPGELAGGIVVASVGLLGLYLGGELTSVREADHATAWAIVALGAAAVVGGLALIIDSSSTTLDFHASPKVSRAPRLNLGAGLALTPKGLEF